jgi:hypothetical protein
MVGLCGFGLQEKELVQLGFRPGRQRGLGILDLSDAGKDLEGQGVGLGGLALKELVHLGVQMKDDGDGFGQPRDTPAGVRAGSLPHVEIQGGTSRWESLEAGLLLGNGFLVGLVDY